MDFIKIKNVLPKDSLSAYLQQLQLQLLSYGYLDYPKAFDQKDNILANYKIVIIDKGEVNVTIQRYHYTIKQGDAILLPPFIYYSLSANKPTAHYYIYFDTLNIQQTVLLAALFPKRCFVANQLIDQPLQQWLSTTHHLIESTNLGKNQLALNLTFNILTLMASKTKSEDPYHLSSYTHSITQTINQALSIIEANIHQSLYVNDIAQSIGVSTSYLNHCFHKVFHIPTKQFIMAYRFHEITLTLTQTDTPISTIAYDFGFSSVYAFSNAFKKLHNVSPSEYRKIYQSSTASNNK